MNKPRIRTLLIEDSSFMRKVISDIISEDESLELIGSAADGKEGVQLVTELRPDVVVTDMIMPEYDGLFVVRQVMEHQPTPIILLSSLDKGSQRIFEALENGAFEFIDKPTELGSKSMKDYPLLSLIKIAAEADISLLKAKPGAPKPTKVHVPLSRSGINKHDVIVIGASTGGPGAIESIISQLPETLSVPVVIVQHMPTRFLETFTQRLNAQSSLPVRLAFKGQSLLKGVIYVLPGDTNTRIERVSIDQDPIFVSTQQTYDEFNFPSINCLFESAAETYGRGALGVILTGMGKDGMRGLKGIHDAGGYTIAQDEETSVVYGMPKAAVEIGAVNEQAAIKDIPNCIIQNL